MRPFSSLMSLVAVFFIFAIALVCGCMFDPRGSSASPTGPSGSAGASHPVEPGECFSDSEYPNCALQGCIDEGYRCYPSADDWQLWMVGNDIAKMPKPDGTGLIKGGRPKEPLPVCSKCECDTTDKAQCVLPVMTCWENSKCEGKFAYTVKSEEKCKNASTKTKSCRVDEGSVPGDSDVCKERVLSPSGELGPWLENETFVYVLYDGLADGENHMGCDEGKVCKLLPSVESLGENQLCVAKSSLDSVDCPAGWSNKRYDGVFYLEKDVIISECPECKCKLDQVYVDQCKYVIKNTVFTAYDYNGCSRVGSSTKFPPNSVCEDVSGLADYELFSIGCESQQIADKPSCNPVNAVTGSPVDYRNPWTVCCLE